MNSDGNGVYGVWNETRFRNTADGKDSLISKYSILKISGTNLWNLSVAYTRDFKTSIKNTQNNSLPCILYILYWPQPIDWVSDKR